MGCHISSFTVDTFNSWKTSFTVGRVSSCDLYSFLWSIIPRTEIEAFSSKNFLRHSGSSRSTLRPRIEIHRQTRRIKSRDLFSQFISLYDFSKLFQNNSKNKNTTLLHVFGKTELVLTRISFPIHTTSPCLYSTRFFLKKS